ncbi:hypothetical protein [Streptomyces prunicolor]|nr:hypothetical protein [Streptomyces prunicolor]
MRPIMASPQITAAQGDDQPHDPIIDEALRRVQGGKGGGNR